MEHFVSFFVHKISFFQQNGEFRSKKAFKFLVLCRKFSIFEVPRPCAMTICGQLARAKAATDL